MASLKYLKCFNRGLNDLDIITAEKIIKNTNELKKYMYCILCNMLNIFTCV